MPQAESFTARMQQFGLEPPAALTGSYTKAPYPDEIAHSQAISLKRIADMMEADRVPVNIRAPDVEDDPLMLIARAMEELSRPTLPQDGGYHERLVEISEREVAAIESLGDNMNRISEQLMNIEMNIRPSR